jgi:ferredoxin
MGRSAWQIRIITLFWPLRSRLARLVGWPLLGRILRPTFRGDQARYIPVQVEIKKTGSTVFPGPWVEKLIAASSFRFILNRCLCRSLECCQHYPRNLGCLFLGEGAREIASSLGKPATVEEALSHHRQAREIGLIPMVGKLRWDSLWLGVKRGRPLLTICHCCDCCCYFKIYRFLPAEAAAGLQRLEGLEVQVQKGCDGCGICAERCFRQAIRICAGQAVIDENCRGCGRCAEVCPQKAVTLVLPTEDSMSEYLRRVAKG